MSGYNWNLRRGSNPTPPMRNSDQIACRICDHVFMSTQALINHIESHILEDGITASRLRLINQQNASNPYLSSTPPILPNSNFLTPNHFFQRNPFLGVNNQIGFPPPPPPPPHFPYQYPQQPQASAYSFPRNMNVNSGVGSHFMMMPISPNQTVVLGREENNTTSDEGTRPFLSQLDYPIPPLDYGQDPHGNANPDNLDLDLKL